MAVKYVEVVLKNASGYYSGRAYTFKTNIDDLQENDDVIVHALDFMAFGKVTKYVDKPEFKCKWLLQRIDLHKEINFLEKLEGTA